MSNTEVDIKRIVAWLAGSISLLLVMLIPLGYYTSSYQYIKENAEFKAEIIAYELSRFVFEYPDTWFLQEHRIDAIISYHLASAARLTDSTPRIRLDDERSEQVYSNSVDIDTPLLTVHTDINDVHQRVGILSLQTSLRALIYRTLGIFLGSLLLGALVFLVLYVLPLRALMRALSELHDTQRTLQEEIQNKEQALEKAHQLSIRLRDMAMHDSLTGLPNRVLLQERLTQALYSAERNQVCIAVIILDLDNFKDVNDSYGHHVGDQLLIEVARRMQTGLRKSDTVARLGGDEFAIVVQVCDAQTGQALADNILRAISEPVDIREQGLSLHTAGSCGIALFPTHDDSPTRLMQKADRAMYTAKKTPGHSALYDLSMELAKNSPR